MKFTDRYNILWPSKLFEKFQKSDRTLNILEFRNLSHFIFEISRIRQKNDNACDISYEKALQQIQNETTDLLKPEEIKLLEQEVKNKLHKRGLITGEVYESYTYTESGTQVDVDVGKYASGDPECVITPVREYIDCFYELFINISYPYHITNKQIQQTSVRLLATIRELEKQHINIKVSVVFPAKKVTPDNDFFSIIPIFSHLDNKSFTRMGSVVNDRLLRKFYFAILENMYGNELLPSYGLSTQSEDVFNLGDEFDEVEFFLKVLGAINGN